MPHYEIFHTCALRAAERHHIASSLTALHCTLFSAPSAFVNITFHHTAAPALTQSRTMYVGGQEAHTNYMIGHLRPRGQDNRPKLLALVARFTAVWNETLRPEAPGRLDDGRALHNVFIMEDIVAGTEQGFVLPVAGNDAKWLEENRGEIERRAGEGDAAMKVLLEESKRGLGKSKL